MSTPRISEEQAASHGHSALTIFRVAVVLLYGLLSIFLGVAFATWDPRNRYQGAVYGSDTPTSPDGTITGTNADLSYPILLGSTFCYLHDLMACNGEIAGGASPPAECCTAFDDASSTPGEVVSEPEAFVIGFCIPAFLLLIRAALVGAPQQRCQRMGGWLSRQGNELWHDVVSYHSIDAIIGLLCTMAVIGTVTQIAKIAVSMPRVNYLALQYFALNSAAGAADSSLKDKWLTASTVSWLSGHSSFTMGGVVFLVMVLNADLSGFLKVSSSSRRLNPVVAAFCPLIFFILVVAYAMVGITRIQGYWHRPIDVVSGWIAGAVSAYFCWKTITLYAYRIEAYAKEKALSKHQEAVDSTRPAEDV